MDYIGEHARGYQGGYRQGAKMIAHMREAKGLSLVQGLGCRDFDP